MGKDRKPPMARPPKPINLGALDRFAEAANGGPKEKSPKPAMAEIKRVGKTIEGYPWDNEQVNEKVIIPFNLRMNQPNNLKLKFLVKHLSDYKSVHDFCMKAVIEKIGRELPKLLNQGKTG